MVNPQKDLDPDKLHVIPFGGCSEFGMNATAYVLQRRLYLVDAGVLFPDPHMLGIASVIPDFGQVFRVKRPVAAYIITHGHEDHIGAMPFLYERWPAPIYGTPWTIELLRRKFEELRISTDDLNLVQLGDTVQVGPLQIEYIHVNHSIPDAASLYITTKGFRVFHTGDFKIDPTPVGAPPVDLDYLAQVGKRGVDLLITDSTNAHRPGPSPSELSVKEPLGDILRGVRGRTFITTFASNLWRLKVIMDLCDELGKKVAIAGRGMANCLELGKRLGYVDFPDRMLVSLEKVNSVPPRDLVVLISGSQGEERAALTRTAYGQHRQLKIQKGDLVLYSSRSIPGNEKNILRVLDQIKRLGGRVITAQDRPDIHVSGHAYGGDLETFIQLLQPRHYLPVHGTYSNLHSNWDIGGQFRSLRDQRTLIRNGDVLRLDPAQTPKVVDRIEIGTTYIDRNTMMPMDVEVAQHRHRVGEIGALIASGSYSLRRKTFVGHPKVQLVGVAVPVGLRNPEWEDEIAVWLEDKVNSWSVKQRHIDSKTLERRVRQLVLQFCMQNVGYRPEIFVHTSVV